MTTRSIDDIRRDLKAAQDKAGRLSDEMIEIHRSAGDKPLTPGQQERFDRVERGCQTAQSEAQRFSDEWRDAVQSGITSGRFKVESGSFGGDDDSRNIPAQRGSHRQVFRGDVWEYTDDIARGAPAQALRSRALTAVERSAEYVPDGASENITHALQEDLDPQGRLARYVIRASDPAYLTAFGKWMRDPQRGHLEWDARELEAFRGMQTVCRAMSIGTTTAGGFMVPYQLDPQILISGTGSVNPMRSVARVETTAQNVAKYVTSAGVTASWDAEAAEVSDDAPTLAQPSITAFKGQAFIPVSLELFEDSDITQQVGAILADAKAQLEATAFTTGAGSTEPKGIITAIAAVGGSVVTSAGSALAVADITANQAALPPRWRPNAKWMANLTIINQGRVLPLYSNGPAAVSDATNPPRMLGWEVLENSAMDGTIAAGTTDDFCLLSGDFKQYIITDRIGTMIELIPTLLGSNRRPSGQRGFHMHWRTGGDAVITDAFRLTNYSA